MNKVILIGRLVRDPELIVNTKPDGQQQSITNFDLAVNRQGTESADFFRCTSFGKQAEFVKKYFRKGKRMAVEGRLRNNNYTSADGSKVFSFNLLVDHVEFADGKAGEEPAGAGGATDANSFVDASKVDDADLPFN